MPPDPTSMIFWLKNRGPAHWRDAWQIEHSVGKYIISDKPMTEEQWALERADVIDGDSTECYPRTGWNGLCATWFAIDNSTLLPRRKPSRRTGLPPITNITKSIDQAVKYIAS
jgi:hypothetical protein